MKDSETLLDRAKRNLLVSKRNFEMIEEDDMFLNASGYFMQQSVELLLKHSLEVEGVKYPLTHNISELISMCDRNKIDIEISRDLRMFSDTITSWESKTRYIKNFFLEKSNVELGFEIVEDLFNHRESNGQNFIKHINVFSKDSE